MGSAGGPVTSSVSAEDTSFVHRINRRLIGSSLVSYLRPQTSLVGGYRSSWRTRGCSGTCPTLPRPFLYSGRRGSLVYCLSFKKLVRLVPRLRVVGAFAFDPSKVVIVVVPPLMCCLTSLGPGEFAAAARVAALHACGAFALSRIRASGANSGIFPSNIHHRPPSRTAYGIIHPAFAFRLRPEASSRLS